MTTKEMMIIKWMDSGFSFSNNIWQSKEDIKNEVEQLQPCETIGFVVAESDNWLYLAQTLNDDVFRGGYAIYKPNIIDRNSLCFKTYKIEANYD